MIDLQTLLQMINEANPSGRKVFKAGFRQYYSPLKPILVNGFSISIQGGERNYCSPRENNLPIEKYYKVEVAVWRKGFQEGQFLCPTNFIPFQTISNTSDSVFAYLTWEQVLEIANLLESIVWDLGIETRMIPQKHLHLELQSGTVEIQG